MSRAYRLIPTVHTFQLVAMNVIIDGAGACSATLYTGNDGAGARNLTADVGNDDINI
jgi:hypothetical protein